MLATTLEAGKERQMPALMKLIGQNWKERYLMSNYMCDECKGPVCFNPCLFSTLTI